MIGSRVRFTFVQLIVVVAIVALLIAYLLPVIQRAHEKANLAQCQDNLRQIGVELILYAHGNDGLLPVSDTIENPQTQLLQSLSAAKISIDLSRYAGDSSFIYPTVVNNRFLQAIIIAPGEPIAVDLGDKDSSGCDPGQAGLSNLPRMCFDTKIEQRC